MGAAIRVTQRLLFNRLRRIREYSEKALRLLTLTLLLCLGLANLSCGGSSKSPVSAAAPLSGNWEITLVRHNNTDQFTFTGFLLQSGSTVTGSFILSTGGLIIGCPGVGSVTGTFDGQNLQLTVGEFGQDYSLSASLPSGSASDTSIAGQFSTLAGGCAGFASTGTWTAVRVLPLTGPFHGSFSFGTGTTATTIAVTGTLTQGSNIGASNASLSGTINETATNAFCQYLNIATITGLISGTTANFTLYGFDGSPIGQIASATVAPNATSLASNGGVTLNQLSGACGPLSGTVTLTFP